MDQSFNAAYYNTVDQIFHAQWTAGKLARLTLLRESIETLWPHGHPTRLIHVGGTSGKGSTCRFLEAGLSLLGKSGAFLSPHIFDYRERFSLAGQLPSRQAVSDAWETRLRPLCIKLARQDEHQAHTFHEVNILMALVLFEQHQIEWAAVEVGLGGRYDQTTALEVIATVLTNIGQDHMELLGDEMWQRTLDKAGIARSGVPFFTSEQDSVNLSIITAVCADVETPLVQVDESHVDQLKARLDVEAIKPGALLAADHQKWNAALGLAVIQHLAPEINPLRLLPKLAAVEFVGRFQQVEAGVYADIAHNPEKIGAIAQDIAQKFEHKGKIFVVGVSGKRAPAAMFAPIMPLARVVIVTGASFKGQDPHEVSRAIEPQQHEVAVHVIPNPEQAVLAAKSMRQPHEVIILLGSTYMIDQALNPDSYLRHINRRFGWRNEG